MDLYAVLGLARDASLGEVKRAYRRLARRYHPDINPGDRVAAAEFRRITEAYETLSDLDRRRLYDAAGDQVGSVTEVVTFGFEGFDFSVSVSGQSAPTFGDLFGDVLQQRGGRRSPIEARRGPDLHQTVILEFLAAMRGVRRRITVTRQEHCRVCHGVGMLKTVESHCGLCEGRGVVKSTRGHMVFSKRCAACGGAGRVTEVRCPGCDGQRTQMRTESLMLSVPPGVADGAQIRVPGKGHAGPPGGEPGDLCITARIEPHPLFQRAGDDLHVVVPIAVHEAALGAKIDVPTLEGVARLRVPPGTQSGQRFRLRERGVPSVRQDRRGDLVAEVLVVLPTVLDERSKDLLREFGEINCEDVRKTLLEAVGGEARVEG